MIDVKHFVNKIMDCEISNFIGIPDSTLKYFCEYLNNSKEKTWNHYVPANEGAAVAMGAGIYLGTGKVSCVYMQNSGLGNAVNPIASLLNKDIYEIPMLFVVGWRGESGEKDEPQHVFQGEITKEQIELLGLKYFVVGLETGEEELKGIFSKIKKLLETNNQVAIIAKQNTFEELKCKKQVNQNEIVREEAIQLLLSKIGEEDVIVSTTGKISREVYEQRNNIKNPIFLTVGSMGHASMIAFGIHSVTSKKVYCIDGDGAALMHMGSMAFIGQNASANFIHIVLNNGAHESVGGMPTGVKDLIYSRIAKECGYKKVYCIENMKQLMDVLENIEQEEELCFIEIKVSMESRINLGRPKEKPKKNKVEFMKSLIVSSDSSFF